MRLHRRRGVCGARAWHCVCRVFRVMPRACDDCAWRICFHVRVRVLRLHVRLAKVHTRALHPHRGFVSRFAFSVSPARLLAPRPDQSSTLLR
eukprot:5319760-Alexandrium_andersonii.AAC.1